MNDYYRVIILLFVAGFTAITGQAVFFRELLAQVSPMETGLAYMFFFWAMGAAAAALIYEKKVLKLTTAKLMMLTAVLPVLNGFITLFSPVLLRLLSGLFAQRGAAESFICASPSLLMGASSGLIFSVLSLAMTLQRKEAIARSALVIFALGAVSSGLIFSLFAAGKTPGLMILYWLGLMNIALSYILFREKGPDGKVITLWVVTAAIIYLLPLMGSLPARFDAYTSAMSYKGSSVLYSAESAGERTVITKSGNEYGLFVNGAKRYSYPDAGLGDFIKTAAPRGNVLLIEGGYAGGVNEIKKYPAVLSVSSVEPFSDSAYASAKFFGADIVNTVNVRFIYGDPEAFFKSAPDRKFDSILVNTPPDSSLLSLRMRSDRILKPAEAALNPGGSLHVRYAKSGAEAVSGDFRKETARGFFSKTQGMAAAIIAVILAVLASLSALGRTKGSSDAPVLMLSAGTGFIAYTLLIIIALYFQGLYGGLYRYFGLILAIFWAGALAGAFLSGRASEWTGPLMVAALVLSAALIFAVYFSAGASGAVMLFTAGAGFIQGALFNSRLRFAGAARLSAAEFSGAAIAALCCGIFVLPALGAGAAAGLSAAAAAAMFLMPQGKEK